MGIIISCHIKYITILVTYKLAGVVTQDASHERLIQVDLPLIFGPVALEPEALIQAWRQYVDPLIIFEDDLRNILLSVGKSNPVK
ncbi:hypothetical protein D3C77_449710 [compost metagenome]